MIGSLSVLAALLVAYGEQDANGHPNMEERFLHVLTNQVRQQPHAWQGWDTSLATNEARQPLYMHDGLFEAARFHADDMAENRCFQHESCDGTTFEVRVSRYFSGPAGENIFMATGGNFTARSAITGWMTSDGHRRNILDGRFTLLGTGFSSPGSMRYYVQDFGIDATMKTAIPQAAVEKLGGGRIRLIANYFNAQNMAPASFTAELGGQALVMEHVVGQPGNATYHVMADEPSGCTPVVFIAGGTTFPSSGALLAGSGCNESFQAGNVMKPDERPVIGADDPSSGCRCATGGGAGSALLLAPLFLLVFVKKMS